MTTLEKYVFFFAFPVISIFYLISLLFKFRRFLVKFETDKLYEEYS